MCLLFFSIYENDEAIVCVHYSLFVKLVQFVDPLFSSVLVDALPVDSSASSVPLAGTEQVFQKVSTKI